MSDSQDGAVLGETETVTVSTEASAESTDPNAVDSTTEGTPEAPVELTEEQKAAAAAETEAKAKAEAAAEAARLDKLATDFIDYLGVRNESGDWVGGLICSDVRDESTGFFPDGVLNDIRAKFNELPAGAVRTRVKTWVDAEVGRAMEDPALSPYARSWFMIKKHSLVSTGAKAPAAPKVTVDVTQAFIDQVLGLYIAPYMVRVPEGVDADWPDKLNEQSTQQLIDAARAYAAHQDKVAALPEDATEEVREALDKEAPEATDVIKAGFRLARGRASVAKPRKAASGTSTPRSPRAAGDGTRKNIANHILSAFAGKPVGTVLSINEIVKTPSDEYGTESPSPGAVSARLFPDKNDPNDGTKCTIPGIEGVINADGRKAAKLVG